MASLKCSSCGSAIRYHDEANGTQYILFSRDVWEKLILSVINISRYLLDGTCDYYTIWKCPVWSNLCFFG